MYKILLSIALAVMLAGQANAQANLYMAGGSYSVGAAPAFAGTAMSAHQVGAGREWLRR
jgi:hypothetical protein